MQAVLGMFDTRTWMQVLTIPSARRLSWDPQGHRLLTGSGDGDVSLWEVPIGTRIHHLRQVGEPVDAVAISPDSRLLVAASRDGASQVWDASSGKLRSQGNYLRSAIRSVEFDPSSTFIVAAGGSGSVAIADAARGVLISGLEASRNPIVAAHFAPGSSRVITASSDGTARIWDAAPPYRRWSSLPVADDCGVATGLEPDRRFVAVSCGDRPTRVWDTARDQLVAELPSVPPVDDDFASALPAVSAAGDRAAIARGSIVEVYELPGGKLEYTVRHDAAVNAVAFATTGHALVSGATDGSLLVTQDNGAQLALPRSSAGIDVVGFLPDGRLVAADAWRRLRVYDARGTLLAELEMMARSLALRMSPDSRRLLSLPRFVGKVAPPERYGTSSTTERSPSSMIRDRGACFRLASSRKNRSSSHAATVSLGSGRAPRGSSVRRTLGEHALSPRPPFHPMAP